jgi:hypothetical protein
MSNLIREEIAEFIRLVRNGAYTSDMITEEILSKIEKYYVSKEIIEQRIYSCLEEQSKYHEDYAEGLHRLEMMLK